MKRYILVIFLVMLFMGVTVMAANDDDEIERTVESINDIRKNIGLEPLIVSDILKEMALVHSKYMHFSDTLTSIEQNKELYFRGRYPWNRADYYEYTLDFVYEFVKKDIVNYKEGYNQLLEDPLSRYILLDPMYSEIGMSLFENHFTYELGGSTIEENQIIVYPYDHQKAVATHWSGSSFDILYEETELEEVGLPITIVYYGNNINKVIEFEVSVMNTKNMKTVDIEIIEPNDLHQIKNAFVLLPTNPYNANTTYKVDISMKIKIEDGDTEVYNRSYEFTTIGESGTTVESKFVTRALFMERIIKNSLLGFTLQEPLKPKFSDVDINSTESIYIYTANQEGLISGYPDGSFKPELNITREQAYIILIKAYEKNNPIISVEESTLLDQYNDHELVSFWAMDYVLKAEQLGILKIDDLEIKPGNYLTEDEFSGILELFTKVLSENIK